MFGQYQYGIQLDLADRHAEHLRLTLIVIGVLSLLWTSYVITAQLPTPFLPIILLISMGIAELLRRREQISVAAWVLIGGLIATPIIYMLEFAAPLWSFSLLPIPVALAGLVRNKLGIVITIALTLVLAAFATFRAHPLYDAIGLIVTPILLSSLLAFVIYVLVDNNIDLVIWAVDNQQKSAERAEVYYQQREQLKEALHQLRVANSKLEQLNHELGIAQREATEASQAKSVFLSNMSHELRTPLNIVIGYSSSLLNMPQMYDNQSVPPIFRDDIALIQSNGQYLLGLINDILDLSKIEAGKLTLNRGVVDLPTLFKGVLATAIGLVRDKPVQLIPDFADDLPLVWADDIRVRQILLNLLSNAVKFTDSGSITLNAVRHETIVEVTVRDTGVGISAEDLQHIFDRFEQARHSPDKQHIGTGLGLDIAQHLSQMHGGELTVTSQVGHGSAFTFSLPVATTEQLAAQPDDPLIQDTPTHADIDVLDIDLTHTVLLVEDQSDTRILLRRAIESDSTLVFDTDRGTQALEIAKGILPDVIVLDLNLPDISGWDVLRKLRADNELKETPVILLTSQRLRHDERTEQVTFVLEKPIATPQLVTYIRRAAQSRTLSSNREFSPNIE